jgi:hypothetical protein
LFIMQFLGHNVRVEIYHPDDTTVILPCAAVEQCTVKYQSNNMWDSSVAMDYLYAEPDVTFVISGRGIDCVLPESAAVVPVSLVVRNHHDTPRRRIDKKIAAAV